MTNVETLTARLNAFQNRRKIFNLLQRIAACEPGVQHSEQMSQEIQILSPEILTRPDVTEVA